MISLLKKFIRIKLSLDLLSVQDISYEFERVYD